MSSSKNHSTLPKYLEPPVVETVLALEFAPIENWGIPHFGLFWQRIRNEFPRFQVQPPLESQIESFHLPQSPPTAGLRLMSTPEVRCWFVDSDDKTLIQVQNNRFIYNWRKRGEEHAYPHYDENIRPRFERVWRLFREFVEAQPELGAVEIVQCEVTYVNQLEAGKGWDSADDVKDVFRCWSGSTGGFLPAPETVGFNVRYRMPNDRGRLHIAMTPAVRNLDGVEILQLTLTARGRPDSGTTDSAIHWLDVGREWVVRGFTDITSEKMHTLWQRSN